MPRRRKALKRKRNDNVDSRYCAPSRQAENEVESEVEEEKASDGGLPSGESVPTPSSHPFKPFDPKSIIPYASMLVYGARRIGKTHLMTYIMSMIYKRFDEVYVFSETIDVQRDSWRFIPKVNRILGFNEAKIKEIMNKQKRDIAKIWNRMKDKPVKQILAVIEKEVPHTLLIFDDIVSNKRVVRSGILEKTYTLGRHLRISQVILSQNANAANSVGRGVRNNVDYVFTSMMPSEAMYEVLADTYFGIEGKKAGMAALKAITADPFTFAVAEIHKQRRAKLTDYVSTIKADAKLKEFKAGDKKLWELENQTAESVRRLTTTKAPAGPKQPKALNSKRESVLKKISDTMNDRAGTTSFYNMEFMML